MLATTWIRESWTLSVISSVLHACSGPFGNMRRLKTVDVGTGFTIPCCALLFLSLQQSKANSGRRIIT
jgi:hypothetical protein